MRVSLAFVLLAASASAAVPGRAGGADPERTYVFAVVPQGPPVVTNARWSPILERIARDTGIPLRIKLYERVETFQTDLTAGVADFAYLNPVQAVRAHRAARYRPLVRDEKPIRGVFFVARDSPFTSVASLAGREVAFVGPWSFCSVSLRHQVRGLGIVPRYVGTGANATKHVLLGLAPAGGLLDVALEDAPPEVRDRLRVVFRTPPMAPHAVVVHPRVPREVADRVGDALRALAREAPGLELMRRVHMVAPMAAEYDRDYAPLEHLLDDAPDARPPGRAR